MSTGLTGKFNILQRSPYDNQPVASLGKEPESGSAVERWGPSRYTVRATTTEGALVLWNTFTNKMSVFKPHLAPRVVELLRQQGTEGRCQGMIKFLVDRGFLIREGTDEYRRFRHAFGKDHYANEILHLFLLASEDCNFRCEYCYEDFTRGTMEPRVRAGVKKFLTSQIPRLRRLKIDWFGGEPLYGMEAIDEIAPFAVELADRHGVDFYSKVTTNAYLLTPDVVDKLFGWRILNYQITIDGPPEHHNRKRPGRDGSPTFDTILRNLREMQKRTEEFSVMLRVNFDRENAPDLDKLLTIIKEELHGDSRFRLAFRKIDQWGGPADDQLAVCTPDETREVQRRVQAEARKRGLLLAGSIHGAGGLGAQVCYAARPDSFVIGATGKVMKCTIDLDRHDRNVVGHLDETGTMTLDQDKMALWTEPAFENDAKCKKCVILPACQGLSCPLVRWETNKSPCVPVRSSYKRALRIAAGDTL